MAPNGSNLSLKHRIRRSHPLLPVMSSELARMDQAELGDIEQYQEKRLRRLVRLAARRSPFYRQYFRESGVDPRSISTLGDLSKLPLLDRRHLAERSDDFAVYPRRLMWAAMSSGTSGSPITTYRTPGSSVYELCALERQWSWFGLRPGSRRVILRGSDFVAAEPGRFTKEIPGGNQLLVSSFHLVPENVDIILAEVERFAPDAIEGWPSSIALLAALLAERGLSLPVTAIITSSEMLNPGQAATMRDVFHAPIADHYGQTERVAMAGSCEAGGYHIFPHYGIVELLPVPDAVDRWEIVGTALHNWGFPLFRYRTGDEVGPAPAGPCACGRSFPRIGAIDGRSEDTFHTADGRPLPMPGAILDDLPGVRESQIVQLEPGTFEVRIVPGIAYDATRTAAVVHSNVDRLFGPGQHVRIIELGRLPRPKSGKLKAAYVESSGRMAERIGRTGQV